MKPWADPSARDPFLWIFKRDDAAGADPIKRAPKNFFHRNELYTRLLKNGERDLSLETYFSKVEKAFNRIRREVLFRGAAVTAESKLVIAAFVAMQSIRTPQMRDHHVDQVTGLIDHIEQFEVAVSNMTQERKRNFARASSATVSSNRGMTKEDLIEVKNEPFHRLGVPLMQTMLKILQKMCLSVVVVDDKRGFITTDAPVTIFDPTAYKRPLLFRSPGLANEAIEVALPLSPNMMALFHWKDGADCYFNPPPKLGEVLLLEYNRRARFLCDKHFVVNGPAVDPNWFKEFPPPPDAWEVLHPEGDADV